MIVAIYIIVLRQKQGCWVDNMNYQIEFLNLIDDKLHKINDSIADLSLNQFDYLMNNKILIEDNFDIDCVEFLNAVDLSKLKSILPSSCDDDLLNLAFYIAIGKTEYVVLMDSETQVKVQLKNILSRVYVYLNQSLCECGESIKRMQNMCANFENIKNKIALNQTNFSSLEMQSIYNVLNELNNRDMAFELLMLFGDNLLKDRTKLLVRNSEKGRYTG